MRYHSIFLSVLVLLSSCSQDDDPIQGQFSIYLFQNSSTTFQEAEDMGLNSVVLEEQAWLEIEDIALYDFSTHFMSLKVDKEALFQGMLDEGHMFNFLVKPFVLVAEDQRIALGSFLSSYSSLMSSGPHIYDMDQIILPADILALQGDGAADIDLREDERIKAALIAGGVFHAGIHVALTDVEIIDNSDTATVSYSFLIRNDDSDDLYVPDPELMGTALFHYYTNGVDFRSSDGHYFFSEYKIIAPPEPYDRWDAAWFVKIGSGDSINRTVILRGYPHFPSDTYTCSFRFSGPSKIARDDRFVQSGRYWIGLIETNPMTVTH